MICTYPTKSAPRTKTPQSQRIARLNGQIYPLQNQTPVATSGMLFNALSTATFLFATITLKGASSLPSDSGRATSASELQNSTTILDTRDTHPDPTKPPVLVFSFHDESPDTHRTSGWKRKADIYNYIPNTCQRVDPQGSKVMKINWNAGFNMLKLHGNSNCDDHDFKTHYVVHQHTDQNNCTSIVFPDDDMTVLSLKSVKKKGEH